MRIRRQRYLGNGKRQCFSDKKKNISLIELKMKIQCWKQKGPFSYEENMIKAQFVLFFIRW